MKADLFAKLSGYTWKGEQAMRLILSGFRYKLLYFSFEGSKMKQFRKKKEFRKEILFLPTQQGCALQLLRGNNIKCNTRGSLEAEAGALI